MKKSIFIFLLVLVLKIAGRAAQDDCVTSFPIILEVIAADKTERKYGFHEFSDCSSNSNEPFACNEDHVVYLKKVATSNKTESTNYKTGSNEVHGEGY
jgi:hypothetical protein